jgi:hypothetical protein
MIYKIYYDKTFRLSLLQLHFAKLLNTFNQVSCPILFLYYVINFLTCRNSSFVNSRSIAITLINCTLLSLNSKNLINTAFKYSRFSTFCVSLGLSNAFSIEFVVPNPFRTSIGELTAEPLGVLFLDSFRTSSCRDCVTLISPCLNFLAALHAF